MNPQRPRDWSTARHGIPAGSIERGTNAEPRDACPVAVAGIGPDEVSRYALRHYVLHAEIGAGSLVTVHLARMVGPDDFARTVAIKRLRPNYAKDTELVSTLLGEARLAGKIRHPNVVPTLDVVGGGELLVVMEYVHGESLSALLGTQRGRGSPAPLAIVSGIFVGLLRGLHAVHEARSESASPIGPARREAAPHEVLVGADGLPRLLGLGVERERDIRAAGATLWEALAGRPLLPRISPDGFEPPSRYRSELTPAIDAIVSKGLAEPPAERFATAGEMALALETAVPPATQSQIGAWVESLARQALEDRARLVARLEAPASDAATCDPPPAAPSEAAPAPPIASATAVTRRERASAPPMFETKRGLGPAGEADAETPIDLAASGPTPSPRSLRAPLFAGLAAAALVAIAGAWHVLGGPRATTDAGTVVPPAATAQATERPVETAASRDEPRERATSADGPKAPPPAPLPSPPPRPARVRRSSKPATRDDVL
jgi:eukaryotic-like serine/threonine-protein kinase